MDILPFDNILTGFRNRGSVTGAGISTGFVCELWVGSPNGTRQFFIVLDNRIVEGDIGRFPAGERWCPALQGELPRAGPVFGRIRIPHPQDRVCLSFHGAVATGITRHSLFSDTRDIRSSQG